MHKKVSVKPFQRLVGSRGEALVALSLSAKSFILTKDQEGSQNNPVNCFGVGNPIKGFPRKSSILYNLTIVVYFFDSLSR